MVESKQVEKKQLVIYCCVRQAICQDVCWRFISLCTFQHLTNYCARFDGKGNRGKFKKHIHSLSQGFLYLVGGLSVSGLAGSGSILQALQMGKE